MKQKTTTTNDGGLCSQAETLFNAGGCSAPGCEVQPLCGCGSTLHLFEMNHWHPESVISIKTLKLKGKKKGIYKKEDVHIAMVTGLEP